MCINIKKPPTYGKPYSRRLWSYDKANWDGMRQHLKDVQWSQKLTSDIESAAENLEATINHAMKKFIPYRDKCISPCVVD